jgi:hypothetical protein
MDDLAQPDYEEPTREVTEGDALALIEAVFTNNPSLPPFKVETQQEGPVLLFGVAPPIGTAMKIGW